MNIKKPRPVLGRGFEDLSFFLGLFFLFANGLAYGVGRAIKKLTKHE